MDQESLVFISGLLGMWDISYKVELTVLDGSVGWLLVYMA
jgi:hypothetical protein